MTETGARAWLPKDAFSLEAVGGCLAGTVEAWAVRWFVRAPAAIAAVRVDASGGAYAAQPGTMVEGVNAVLELSGHGKRRLLEAVLDVDLSSQSLGEGDRRLMDEVARGMVRDLAVSLDTILPQDGSPATASTVVSTLTVAGHDALSLRIRDCMLAPLIKAAMTPVATFRPALARRADAVKRTALNIHGHVGRAELTIDELEGLGIGDVLVLDRPLAEPVELRLRGNESPLARGRLNQDTGSISLQL